MNASQETLSADCQNAYSASYMLHNNVSHSEENLAHALELGINSSTENASYQIFREIIDQLKIEKNYRKSNCNNSIHQKCIKKISAYCTCSTSCVLSIFLRMFPVLSWLPRYNCREYLINDIIAGFTVAILHIPQGMAYGLLASVNAINGLYVSFFPVLIYFLMGTSRHISVGTFAVVSMMLSSTIEKLETVKESNALLRNDTVISSQTIQTIHNNYPTNIEVLTTVSLVTGGMQLLMGVLHLGTLTVLLSDNLVSGFSTGAAVHVATSQMKDLFDINIGKYNGPFKLIYKFRDIFQNIQHSNIATVVISAVAITILAVVKEKINSRYRTKLKMPVPIDLIVVIIATITSYFGKFSENFEVKIMGDIPTGLPIPVVPRTDLIPKVAIDSLSIAIVAFAITMSMAKIFIKKYKYEIDSNQELLALGSANIFSSFFLCYPCATSMSRSLVQERAGGKTQLSAFISCLILLVVLLALGPYFYNLPKCILSCIILVALKGMFLQICDLRKALKVSLSDGMIWLVTFFSVILIDVDYGLFVGVIFSVLIVIFYSIMPYKTTLGNLPQTDIYLDVKQYNEVNELPGLKIFHYGTSLNFINKENFKSSLMKNVLINKRDDETDSSLLQRKVECIIIDCCSITYMDSSSIEMLTELINEFKEKDIMILFANCSVKVIDMLKKTEFFTKVTEYIFPTVHDAVLFFNKTNEIKIQS
ncbi:prestin-like [Centruroides vittatus]|uniref:prestin-like n=1 Tax=Centruroides vittatus TaxID=120091 RepID=UPI00350EA99A